MIKHCAALLIALAILKVESAVAQSSSQLLVGTWTSTLEGATCGKTVIKVTAVESNGVVRGALECPKRGTVLILGEKIEFNKAMSAKFDGTKLKMDGANGSGLLLEVNASSMVGTYLPSAKEKVTPASFVKQ